MSGPWVKSLKVEYRDEAGNVPDKSIPEINQNAPDINKGFSGRYVYLVPEWTYNKADACNYISIEVTDKEQSHRQDLAKKAEGKFRYLTFLNNQYVPKIKKVSLYRKAKADGPVNFEDVNRNGYTHFSKDINAGRGGDYLSLIWNEL